MPAALLALTLVIGAPAGASPEGAADFVQRVADDIIDLVSDPSVPAAQRERILAEEFRVEFDLATISRYTLGRYWDTATAAERAEYQALFVDYLVRKYIRLSAATATTGSTKTLKAVLRWAGCCSKTAVYCGWNRDPREVLPGHQRPRQVARLSRHLPR